MKHLLQKHSKYLWLSLLLLLVGATAIAIPKINGINGINDASVAKIGDTEYATLQAAVDAAQNGETVTLFANTTENVVVPVGKDITLSIDKNVTLSGGGSSNKKAAIENKGTLTIKGSGTIKREDTAAANGDGQAAYYVILNNGTMTISGVTVTNDSGPSVEGGKWSGSSLICNGTTNTSPSLKITGGTYTQNNFIVIKNDDYGTLNITGGTFNSKDQAVQNWNTTTITGGTFNGDVKSWAWEGNGAQSNPTISINGGTFNNCEIGTAFDGTPASNSPTLAISKGTFNNCTLEKAEGSELTISGGTFNGGSDPTEYGYEPSFMVTKADGTISYASLTTISAAGTYKLLKDVELYRIGLTTNMDKITIDLNGHTLAQVSGYTSFCLLYATKSITVNEINIIDTSAEKGGKIIANTGGNAVAAISIGKQVSNTTVNIGEGVTIEGNTVLIEGTNNTLNVEGTINGGNDFAVCTNGSTTTNATINIKEGAVLTSTGTAVYLPGTGTTTIVEGASITGATGVYVKSGTLNITGGEITGNGAAAEFEHNGNGANATGDALVVENCDYPGGAPVVSVTGGKFTSTNAAPIGSYAQEGYEPLSNFVSGGYFNKELDADLCATGKKTASSTTMTGYYEVVEIVYVAQIGDVKYETLGEAFTAAANGSTITLLTDVELTDRLFVNAGATPAYAGTNNRYATTSEDKSITLDLNGNNITSSSNIALAGGSLNIVNNGTADATHGVISTSNSGLAPIEVRGTGDLTSKRTLTIGENVTLKGGEYGLNIFGSNDAQKNIIEVTVNGKVEGDLFVLGNLTNDDNNILITVNGSVDASGIELGAEKAKTGVALNGNAKVVVNDGASVKGETAIEVRAGELTVNGGTITGTASEYSYTPNGSGTTVKGVAIAVAPYNAEKDLRVTVSDGTLSGAKTIAVVDVQNNLEKVTVKAKDDFVDGADETVIPESYKWVSDGEGMSTLTPRNPIAKIGETVYYSLAAAVAAVPTDGTETTIELLANVTENVVVKDGKNIVLDLGGKTVTGYIDQYDSNITLTNGNLAGTFYVNGGPSSAEAGYNKFTLAADATITSDWGFILYQGPNGNDAYGSTIDINGTINGTAWVMGNITEGNSVINVNNGATIDGDVFGLNGLATLNVKAGATIIGAETGIEVRAGNLNVEGGTITSTSTEYKVESNGSGTTTYGAAIAVAQHTTGLPINANITGGTLTGLKTISVADPEGGNYAGVVVTAKDELTEGEVVIPDGYIWISNNDGTSTLTKAEHGEYVLIDGEDYPFMNLKSDISVPEVTYKRSFSEGQINKHQAWFVPMDYTITADDAENFTFYKIQMIAGAAEAGEADHDLIYLYIEPMSEGEILRGNRPYTVKPKNAVSNYEFTADGTKLYAPNTGSRLNVTTSFHSYDFYGKYARESYSGSVGDMFFLSGGSLHPNNATTTLLPYRWIIKVTANTINDDYSKIEFSIVEDGDATGIDRTHVINSDEVEGIYTTNGMKVDEPVRGINIIRYKNGKTEKIIVK